MMTRCPRCGGQMLSGYGEEPCCLACGYRARPTEQELAAMTASLPGKRAGPRCIEPRDNLCDLCGREFARSGLPGHRKACAQRVRA